MTVQAVWTSRGAFDGDRNGLRSRRRVPDVRGPGRPGRPPRPPQGAAGGRSLQQRPARGQGREDRGLRRPDRRSPSSASRPRPASGKARRRTTTRWSRSSPSTPSGRR
ncbi:MAG: hypothetical protein M0C28_02475 [Candidatus Moduliflexus flocculans]|nr:hypothetical protein [Candidatus Moduliflexus flocculans]